MYLQAKIQYAVNKLLPSAIAPSGPIISDATNSLSTPLAPASRGGLADIGVGSYSQDVAQTAKGHDHEPNIYDIDPTFGRLHTNTWRLSSGMDNERHSTTENSSRVAKPELPNKEELKSAVVDTKPSSSAASSHSRFLQTAVASGVAKVPRKFEARLPVWYHDLENEQLHEVHISSRNDGTVHCSCPVALNFRLMS